MITHLTESGSKMVTPYGLCGGIFFAGRAGKKTPSEALRGPSRGVPVGRITEKGPSAALPAGAKGVEFLFSISYQSRELGRWFLELSGVDKAFIWAGNRAVMGPVPTRVIVKRRGLSRRSGEP